MVPRLYQIPEDAHRRYDSGSHTPCGAHLCLCSGLVFGLSRLILVGVLTASPSIAFAEKSSNPSPVKQLAVPILGTTLNRDWEQVGIVAEVDIQFERRMDQQGLQVYFQTKPGRFSPVAQRAVTQAIHRAAEVGRLSTESWTITLTLPYPGVTMYGESLSAMVGLSVLALARGDPLPPDRVLTGTIMPDGHIGVVGGVPLKILAAHKRHFRRVLIPEEQDVADGDWQTPFLMQVSPVGNVRKAYQGLTDCSLEMPSPQPLTSVLSAMNGSTSP